MLLETLRRGPSLPVDGTGWVARMHARPLRSRERRALSSWITASPDHARELLRAETVWRLSGALARDTEVQAELAKIAPTCRLAGVTSALVGQRASLRWVAVACLLLITLVVLSQALEAGKQRYETAIGEQRVITLADGSTVALNTATRISVEYSAHERRVRLEGGEALFQVAHEVKRPFIVGAGVGSARAVGTRFNVVRDAESVTVVVLEGLVEVLPKATDPRGSRRLTTGESAAFALSGKLTTVPPERASPERIVAWREGKLRFDSWSLEQAVTEHNRYASKPIRLDGNIPADVRISGVFRIGDTRAFLSALRELMPIQVLDGPQSLFLTAPASAAASSAQP